MPSPTLPVSRLINVQVNLTPSAAAAQNLSTLLILGQSQVIDTNERFRSYPSIDTVAADFGTTAPEYLAALLWFQQLPQPNNLLIGRWASSATNGVLRGAPLSTAQQALINFSAVSGGKIKFTLDGGSSTDSSAINLTGAASLPAVAALISAQTPGITVTWNAVYQRFEAVSNTTGAASAVGFMQTPGSGTDLSALVGMQATQSGAYVQGGIAAETALQAVAYFDLNYGQTFYGLTILGATDTDHLAVGPFVNALGNKHIYFVTSNSAGVLVPSVTSDIAYQLSLLNLLRVWVQYSSTNPYAAVSAAARILTTEYTGNSTVITLMYKTEPGVTAESINSVQTAALEAKNCNVFVNYANNTAIIEPGVSANGTFLDVVTGTDWLSLTIQAALYNLLYTSTTKIPQTDTGANLLVNTIEAVCSQGVVNGLLAAGVWNNGGFGNLKQNDFMAKGFYVFAPKVSTQSASDRAKRRAVPIQVAAKLAGAVHTIAMQINVNN